MSIKIYENILPNDLIEKLSNYVNDEILWKYGWSSNPSLSEGICHWNHDFLKSHSDNTLDKSNNLISL